MTTDVKLEAPGAGLPTYERLLLRHVVLPRMCRRMSWADASHLFADEAGKIIAIAGPLSEEKIGRRVLIRRIAGIEDSSRHWSVSMTMEHLVIVGSSILALMTALCNEVDPGGTPQIANFKPSGTQGRGVIDAFESFADDYVLNVEEHIARRTCSRTHPHPWFGPFTPHQWHCLAAAHQRIHRRQVERIARAL